MPIANLIIVIGQSQSMSQGTTDLPVPGGWTPDAGISIWNRGTALFETYAPGVNSEPGLGTTCWGPEAEFCRQRRLLVPKHDVYIYKWTRIAGVAKSADPAEPDWSPYSTGKTFDDVLPDIQAALAGLVTGGYAPIVDAMLWLGNENDSRSPADSEACHANMLTFIRAWRELIPAPHMKFITERISYSLYGYQAGFEAVRAAQVDIGSRRGNAWVNTDDLAVREDNIIGHYNPNSVVLLGKRMFDAEQDILANREFVRRPLPQRASATG